jgi:phosphoserine phosphatase RsbU/P
MVHPQRRLRVLGAIGVAVLLAGLAVAMLRLPEWRNRHMPREEFFGTRLQQVARQAGLALASQPRTQIRSKGWLHDEDQFGQYDTAYDYLGAGAADWLAREGRGPYVETIARSKWSDDQAAGELRVLFSLRGAPVTAMWVADNPFRASRSQRSEAGPSRRRALVRIFGAGDASETELALLGETVHLTPVPGSNPPQTLIGTSIGGPAMPYVQRVVGTSESWRQRLERLSLHTIVLQRLPRMLIIGVTYLGTLILFFFLLARRRIELTKGAILAAVSVALSLAGPIGTSAGWIQMVDSALGVLVKGLALFILWSAAESWLRSTIPGFRTSLDMLRAGRLGPTGGRALLTGSAIGAGVAGLSLLAFAAATMIPGVAPMDASVRLPAFCAAASPIDEGAVRTAFVLLAICAAVRWPLVRRIRGSATVLAALLLAIRIPLSSFSVSFAFGLLLAIVFVQTYRRFGLTALLAAAMMSTVLPATIFSFMHLSWLPASSALLLAVAAAPVLFGTIGIRRPAEVEEGTLRMPGFVRRLEEEHRVKHEMDLLARMQLGLLPQKMPRIAGYDVAARSILATEAGGDLYDFVTDSLGRTWIAAGDVSGHGYSCAIAQAMAKAGLASLVEADRTPSMVLSRLDTVLRGIGAPRTFTSMALLRLDPATGDTLLSNAGHPFPWIATDGGEVRELELPSLPLGQGPPRQYTDMTFTIERGMALLLFSDGLFEASDAAGRPYGFDRIRALLGKTARRPAADILVAFIEDWRRHVGADAPEDDTTIVVVKRAL